MFISLRNCIELSDISKVLRNIDLKMNLETQSGMIVGCDTLLVKVLSVLISVILVCNDVLLRSSLSY